MSEQTAWSIERNDLTEQYELLDGTGAIVALIPIGNKSGEMARQRRVRDLIVAAPAMQRAIRLALAEVEKQDDKTTFDALRTILSTALGASTGAA